MAKLTVSQYNTFKKFMQLTTSENDAEALVALRKANDVLAKQGVTWQQVLDKLVTLATDEPMGGVDNFDRNEEGDRHPTPGRGRVVDKGEEIAASQKIEAINAAFRAVENGAVKKGTSFYSLLMQFKDQWETRNFLSPKQTAILLKAAEPSER